MAARLQAMIATLDDMLPAESEYREPTLLKTPAGVQITIDERVDRDDIKDWVDAFFSHPERIQIKQFKVTK